MKRNLSLDHLNNASQYLSHLDEADPNDVAFSFLNYLAEAIPLDVLSVFITNYNLEPDANVLYILRLDREKIELYESNFNTENNICYQFSDDVITSVPNSLREGSLAMGAFRSESIKTVILPAALPGIVSAFLLAVSRAVGETMIVVMAAGLRPNLTWNPLEGMTTVTVRIVDAFTGDQAFDSPETLSAFGLGLVLLVVTLVLNVISLVVIRRFRQQYE